MSLDVMKAADAEIGRYELLYGGHIRRGSTTASGHARPAIWPMAAVDVLVEELLTRGVSDVDRVEAAFREAARKSPKFCPRPAEVLAVLAEPTVALTQTASKGRAGCAECRADGTPGFRQVHVVRPNGTTGPLFLADCQCHRGRSPLLTPLGPKAKPGSVLRFVSSLPVPTATAQATTDHWFEVVKQRGQDLAAASRDRVRALGGASGG